MRRLEGKLPPMGPAGPWQEWRNKAIAPYDCYALAAGTMGNLLKRSRAYLEIERYVSGVLFIGLGMVAALAGNQKK